MRETIALIKEMRQKDIDDQKKVLVNSYHFILGTCLSITRSYNEKKSIYMILLSNLHQPCREKRKKEIYKGQLDNSDEHKIAQL